MCRRTHHKLTTPRGDHAPLTTTETTPPRATIGPDPNSEFQGTLELDRDTRGTAGQTESGTEHPTTTEITAEITPTNVDPDSEIHTNNDLDCDTRITADQAVIRPEHPTAADNTDSIHPTDRDTHSKIDAKVDKDRDTKSTTERVGNGNEFLTTKRTTAGAIRKGLDSNSEIQKTPKSKRDTRENADPTGPDKEKLSTMKTSTGTTSTDMDSQPDTPLTLDAERDIIDTADSTARGTERNTGITVRIPLADPDPKGNTTRFLDREYYIRGTTALAKSGKKFLAATDTFEGTRPTDLDPNVDIRESLGLECDRGSIAHPTAQGKKHLANTGSTAGTSLTDWRVNYGTFHLDNRGTADPTETQATIARNQDIRRNAPRAELFTITGTSFGTTPKCPVSHPEIGVTPAGGRDIRSTAGRTTTGRKPPTPTETTYAETTCTDPGLKAETDKAHDSDHLARGTADQAAAGTTYLMATGIAARIHLTSLNSKRVTGGITSPRGTGTNPPALKDTYDGTVTINISPNLEFHVTRVLGLEVRRTAARTDNVTKSHDDQRTAAGTNRTDQTEIGRESPTAKETTSETILADQKLSSVILVALDAERVNRGSPKPIETFARTRLTTLDFEAAPNTTQEHTRGTADQAAPATKNPSPDTQECDMGAKADPTESGNEYLTSTKLTATDPNSTSGNQRDTKGNADTRYGDKRNIINATATGQEHLTTTEATNRIDLKDPDMDTADPISIGNEHLTATEISAGTPLTNPDPTGYAQKTDLECDEGGTSDITEIGEELNTATETTVGISLMDPDPDWDSRMTLYQGRDIRGTGDQIALGKQHLTTTETAAGISPYDPNPKQGTFATHDPGRGTGGITSPGESSTHPPTSSETQDGTATIGTEFHETTMLDSAIRGNAGKMDTGMESPNDKGISAETTLFDFYSNSETQATPDLECDISSTVDRSVPGEEPPAATDIITRTSRSDLDPNMDIRRTRDLDREVRGKTDSMHFGTQSPVVKGSTARTTPTRFNPNPKSREKAEEDRGTCGTTESADIGTESFPSKGTTAAATSTGLDPKLEHHVSVANQAADRHAPHETPQSTAPGKEPISATKITAATLPINVDSNLETLVLNYNIRGTADQTVCGKVYLTDTKTTAAIHLMWNTRNTADPPKSGQGNTIATDTTIRTDLFIDSNSETPDWDDRRTADLTMAHESTARNQDIGDKATGMEQLPTAGTNAGTTLTRGTDGPIGFYETVEPAALSMETTTLKGTEVGTTLRELDLNSGSHRTYNFDGDNIGTANRAVLGTEHLTVMEFTTDTPLTDLNHSLDISATNELRLAHGRTTIPVETAMNPLTPTVSKDGTNSYLTEFGTESLAAEESAPGSIRTDPNYNFGIHTTYEGDRTTSSTSDLGAHDTEYRTVLGNTNAKTETSTNTPTSKEIGTGSLAAEATAPGTTRINPDCNTRGAADTTEIGEELPRPTGTTARTTCTDPNPDSREENHTTYDRDQDTRKTGDRAGLGASYPPNMEIAAGISTTDPNPDAGILRRNIRGENGNTRGSEEPKGIETEPRTMARTTAGENPTSTDHISTSHGSDDDNKGTAGPAALGTAHHTIAKTTIRISLTNLKTQPETSVTCEPERVTSRTTPEATGKHPLTPNLESHVTHEPDREVSYTDGTAVSETDLPAAARANAGTDPASPSLNVEIQARPGRRGAPDQAEGGSKYRAGMKNHDGITTTDISPNLEPQATLELDHQASGTAGRTYNRTESPGVHRSNLESQGKGDEQRDTRGTVDMEKGGTEPSASARSTAGASPTATAPNRESRAAPGMAQNIGCNENWTRGVTEHLTTTDETVGTTPTGSEAVPATLDWATKGGSERTTPIETTTNPPTWTERKGGTNPDPKERPRKDKEMANGNTPRDLDSYPDDTQRDSENHGKVKDGGTRGTTDLVEVGTESHASTGSTTRITLRGTDPMKENPATPQPDRDTRHDSIPVSTAEGPREHTPPTHDIRTVPTSVPTVTGKNKADSASESTPALTEAGTAIRKSSPAPTTNGKDESTPTTHENTEESTAAHDDREAENIDTSTTTATANDATIPTATTMDTNIAHCTIESPLAREVTGNATYPTTTARTTTHESSASAIARKINHESLAACATTGKEKSTTKIHYSTNGSPVANVDCKPVCTAALTAASPETTSAPDPTPKAPTTENDPADSTPAPTQEGQVDYTPPSHNSINRSPSPCKQAQSALSGAAAGDAIYYTIAASTTHESIAPATNGGHSPATAEQPPTNERTKESNVVNLGGINVCTTAHNTAGTTTHLETAAPDQTSAVANSENRAVASTVDRATARKATCHATTERTAIIESSPLANSRSANHKSPTALTTEGQAVSTPIGHICSNGNLVAKGDSTTGRTINERIPTPVPVTTEKHAKNGSLESSPTPAVVGQTYYDIITARTAYGKRTSALTRAGHFDSSPTLHDSTTASTSDTHGNSTLAQAVMGTATEGRGPAPIVAGPAAITLTKHDCTKERTTTSFLSDTGAPRTMATETLTTTPTTDPCTTEPYSADSTIESTHARNIAGNGNDCTTTVKPERHGSPASTTAGAATRMSRRTRTTAGHPITHEQPKVSISSNSGSTTEGLAGPMTAKTTAEVNTGNCLTESTFARTAGGNAAHPTTTARAVINESPASAYTRTANQESRLPPTNAGNVETTPINHNRNNGSLVAINDSTTLCTRAPTARSTIDERTSTCVLATTATNTWSGSTESTTARDATRPRNLGTTTAQMATNESTSAPTSVGPAENIPPTNDRKTEGTTECKTDPPSAGITIQERTSASAPIPTGANTEDCTIDSIHAHVAAETVIHENISAPITEGLDGTPPPHDSTNPSTSTSQDRRAGMPTTEETTAETKTPTFVPSTTSTTESKFAHAAAGTATHGTPTPKQGAPTTTLTATYGITPTAAPITTETNTSKNTTKSTSASAEAGTATHDTTTARTPTHKSSVPTEAGKASQENISIHTAARPEKDTSNTHNSTAGSSATYFDCTMECIDALNMAGMGIRKKIPAKKGTNTADRTTRSTPPCAAAKTEKLTPNMAGTVIYESPVPTAAETPVNAPTTDARAKGSIRSNKVTTREDTSAPTTAGTATDGNTSARTTEGQASNTATANDSTNKRTSANEDGADDHKWAPTSDRTTTGKRTPTSAQAANTADSTIESMAASTDTRTITRDPTPTVTTTRARIAPTIAGTSANILINYDSTKGSTPVDSGTADHNTTSEPTEAGRVDSTPDTHDSTQESTPANYGSKKEDIGAPTKAETATHVTISTDARNTAEANSDDCTTGSSHAPADEGTAPHDSISAHSMTGSYSTTTNGKTKESTPANDHNSTHNYMTENHDRAVESTGTPSKGETIIPEITPTPSPTAIGTNAADSTFARSTDGNVTYSTTAGRDAIHESMAPTIARTVTCDPTASTEIQESTAPIAAEAPVDTPSTHDRAKGTSPATHGSAPSTGGTAIHVSVLAQANEGLAGSTATKHDRTNLSKAALNNSTAENTGAPTTTVKATHAITPTSVPTTTETKAADDTTALYESTPTLTTAGSANCTSITHYNATGSSAKYNSAPTEVRTDTPDQPTTDTKTPTLAQPTTEKNKADSTVEGTLACAKVRTEQPTAAETTTGISPTLPSTSADPGKSLDLGRKARCMAGTRHLHTQSSRAKEPTSTTGNSPTDHQRVLNSDNEGAEALTETNETLADYTSPAKKGIHSTHDLDRDRGGTADRAARTTKYLVTVTDAGISPIRTPMSTLEFQIETAGTLLRRLWTATSSLRSQARLVYSPNGTDPTTVTPEGDTRGTAEMTRPDPNFETLTPLSQEQGRDGPADATKPGDAHLSVIESTKGGSHLDLAVHFGIPDWDNNGTTHVIVTLQTTARNLDARGNRLSRGPPTRIIAENTLKNPDSPLDIRATSKLGRDPRGTVNTNEEPSMPTATSAGTTRMDLHLDSNTTDTSDWEELGLKQPTATDSTEGTFLTDPKPHLDISIRHKHGYVMTVHREIRSTTYAKENNVRTSSTDSDCQGNVRMTHDLGYERGTGNPSGTGKQYLTFMSTAAGFSLPDPNPDPEIHATREPGRVSGGTSSPSETSANPLTRSKTYHGRATIGTSPNLKPHKTKVLHLALRSTAATMDIDTEPTDNEENAPGIIQTGTYLNLDKTDQPAPGKDSSEATDVTDEAYLEDPNPNGDTRKTPDRVREVRGTDVTAHVGTESADATGNTTRTTPSYPDANLKIYENTNGMAKLAVIGTESLPMLGSADTTSTCLDSELERQACVTYGTTSSPGSHRLLKPTAPEYESLTAVETTTSTLLTDTEYIARIPKPLALWSDVRSTADLAGSGKDYAARGTLAGTSLTDSDPEDGEGGNAGLAALVTPDRDTGGNVYRMEMHKMCGTENLEITGNTSLTLTNLRTLALNYDPRGPADPTAPGKVSPTDMEITAVTHPTGDTRNTADQHMSGMENITATGIIIGTSPTDSDPNPGVPNWDERGTDDWTVNHVSTTQNLERGDVLGMEPPTITGISAGTTPTGPDSNPEILATYGSRQDTRDTAEPSEISVGSPKSTKTTDRTTKPLDIAPNRGSNGIYGRGRKIRCTGNWTSSIKDHLTATKITGGTTVTGPEADLAILEYATKGTADLTELRSDLSTNTANTDGNALNDLKAKPESHMKYDLERDTTDTSGEATLSEEHPTETKLASRTPLNDSIPDLDTSATYESGRVHGRITTPAETATNPPTCLTRRPWDPLEMMTGNTPMDLDSYPDVHMTHNPDQDTRGTADLAVVDSKHRATTVTHDGTVTIDTSSNLVARETLTPGYDVSCTTDGIRIGTESPEVWETTGGNSLTDPQPNLGIHGKTDGYHDTGGTADLTRVRMEFRTSVCTAGMVHLGIESPEAGEESVGTTLTDLRNGSEIHGKANENRTADLEEERRESSTYVGITTRITLNGSDPNPDSLNGSATDDPTDRETAAGITLTTPDAYSKPSDHATKGTAERIELGGENTNGTTSTLHGSLETHDWGVLAMVVSTKGTFLNDPKYNPYTSVTSDSGRPLGRIATSAETVRNTPTCMARKDGTHPDLTETDTEPLAKRVMAIGNVPEGPDSNSDLHTTLGMDRHTRETTDQAAPGLNHRTTRKSHDGTGSIDMRSRESRGDLGSDRDVCYAVGTVHIGNESPAGRGNTDGIRTDLQSNAEIHRKANRHHDTDNAGTTPIDLLQDSAIHRKVSQHHDTRGTTDLTEGRRESCTSVGLTTRTTHRGTDSNLDNLTSAKDDPTATEIDDGATLTDPNANPRGTGTECLDTRKRTAGTALSGSDSFPGIEATPKPERDSGSSAEATRSDMEYPYCHKSGNLGHPLSESVTGGSTAPAETGTTPLASEVTDDRTTATDTCHNLDFHLTPAPDHETHSAAGATDSRIKSPGDKGLTPIDRDPELETQTTLVLDHRITADGDQTEPGRKDLQATTTTAGSSLPTWTLKQIRRRPRTRYATMEERTSRPRAGTPHSDPDSNADIKLTPPGEGGIGTTAVRTTPRAEPPSPTDATVGTTLSDRDSAKEIHDCGTRGTPDDRDTRGAADRIAPGNEHRITTEVTAGALGMNAQPNSKISNRDRGRKAGPTRIHETLTLHCSIRGKANLTALLKKSSQRTLIQTQTNTKRITRTATPESPPNRQRPAWNHTPTREITPGTSTDYTAAATRATQACEHERTPAIYDCTAKRTAALLTAGTEIVVVIPTPALTTRGTNTKESTSEGRLARATAGKATYHTTTVRIETFESKTKATSGKVKDESTTLQPTAGQVATTPTTHYSTTGSFAAHHDSTTEHFSATAIQTSTDKRIPALAQATTETNTNHDWIEGTFMRASEGTLTQDTTTAPTEEDETSSPPTRAGQTESSLTSYGTIKGNSAADYGESPREPDVAETVTQGDSSALITTGLAEDTPTTKHGMKGSTAGKNGSAHEYIGAPPSAGTAIPESTPARAPEEQADNTVTSHNSTSQRAQERNDSAVESMGTPKMAGKATCVTIPNSVTNTRGINTADSTIENTYECTKDNYGTFTTLDSPYERNPDNPGRPIGNSSTPNGTGTKTNERTPHSSPAAAETSTMNHPIGSAPTRAASGTTNDDSTAAHTMAYRAPITHDMNVSTPTTAGTGTQEKSSAAASPVTGTNKENRTNENLTACTTATTAVSDCTSPPGTAPQVGSTNGGLSARIPAPTGKDANDRRIRPKEEINRESKHRRAQMN